VKLLLDTHLLLWAAEAHPRLPAEARELIADPSNTLLFSVASIWEVAVKSTLKRDDFVTDPALLRRSLLDNAYTELPINGPHVIAVAALPPIHKDPFDRLLVAQALVEGIMFLTSDRVLARYPAPVRVV
jgi:PIN domain nuclease of toxin-antitoxin system